MHYFRIFSQIRGGSNWSEYTCKQHEWTSALGSFEHDSDALPLPRVARHLSRHSGEFALLVFYSTINMIIVSTKRFQHCYEQYSYEQSFFMPRFPNTCVSAPSEITRVWFYIYPMPQTLPKNNFYFRNSTRQVRHDVDLSNNTHDVIEDPDDNDATEPRKSVLHKLPRLDRRTPHGSNFVSFLRNISRWW
jgi:hypothetical protein